MKTIFQLCYKLENEEIWHDVLYSSNEKADEMLVRYYAIGMHINEKLIINSFVINRILF